MDREVAALFRNVLLVCDEMKLIGREMFAIDGCKLPSNAAKERSGTKAELEQKNKKMEKAVRHMLRHHREEDTRQGPVDDVHRSKEEQAMRTMKHQIEKLKGWLDDNDDKPGKTGKPKKSNITNILDYLYTHDIDADVPDTDFRWRDPRFKAAETHKVNHRKQQRKRCTTQHYTSSDFHYDASTHTGICPAGKILYSNGRSRDLNGYEALRFGGAKRDCLPCSHRAQCMENPDKTQTRQASIFVGRSQSAPQPYIEHMKHKIDTAEGRYHYSCRIGIVEPVFGNISSTLGLHRFTLRTKTKVDIQ